MNAKVKKVLFIAVVCVGTMAVVSQARKIPQVDGFISKVM